jgi:hypothetical protein
VTTSADGANFPFTNITGVFRVIGQWDQISVKRFISEALAGKAKQTRP